MDQESQSDESINLYFITQNVSNSENECSMAMNAAFAMCEQQSLHPEWISEKQCRKITPTKTDVFVIDKFEGDTFELLKSTKSTIVSPKCISYCLQNGVAIPAGTSPIYNVAMNGLCVCVSGVTVDVKEHIEKRVSYMGGYFTKHLRSSVTHLVTDCVMSSKYEIAVERKIKIVTKEWVDAVWEANLTQCVQADHSMFDKFKAPVFLNLIVTSTNLTKHEKNETKRLIIENGGTFMGPLDGAKVKIVIASADGPVSEKLKYARRANIACLTPQWIYDSVKCGYALPFRNYLISSLKASSTPEKNKQQESMNCSTISAIFSDTGGKNLVDESLRSTASNISTMSSVCDLAQNNCASPNVTIAEAKLAGPFLDGCNIYLAGFAPHHRDKLNKILNAGSATRFDDISDALTHVIIGDEQRASADLKQITAKGLCPFILTSEWIEESMRLKHPAPEEPYLFQFKNKTSNQPTEPPSPLSKKNLQMLQKPRRPPIPSFNIDKKPPEKFKEPDLVDEYLQKTNDTNNLEVSGFGIKQSDAGNNEKSGIIDLINGSKRSSETSKLHQNSNLADESSIPTTQTLNDKLFEGLTFILSGFSKDENEVFETIIEFDGKIVPLTYSGIPDYGVVPKCGAPLKHTVNEVVTNLFIEDCANQQRIVDIEYYHRPLSIKKHSNPLSGCIITMSIYHGVERTYLMALATELGATCQDVLSRVTKVEEQKLASTHLVCPSPQGNKYKAAVKWKLPVVTADWLKQCAIELKLVYEGPYLVGESIAPERPSQTNKANDSVVSSNETDLTESHEVHERIMPTIKRRLTTISNQETPISKRLSILKKDDYPQTPNSPYGQQLKPNQSPNTRKKWIVWIDNVTDPDVQEPPAKRRASTPLTDLRRRLTEKITNQVFLNNPPDADQSLTTAKGLSRPQTPKGDKAPDEIPQPALDSSPINRKLVFTDEIEKQNSEINLQIAHLDEALQRTPNTPESRYSLSGEATNYDTQPVDHIEKCITKDTQPVDAIVWEDPCVRRSLAINDEDEEDKSTKTNEKDLDDLSTLEEIKSKSVSEPPLKRKFMLSGIKDRAGWEQVIRELGGDVSLDANFDETATHLLCMRPSRNEKLLGSIASGKWVLHCHYLQDCEQAGKFLDEEKYEWGNPKSEGIIPGPSNEAERLIAKAAHRWRLKMLKEPRGPFEDIVALLLFAGDKYDQFKRLIEAGGGRVVQARPPYDTSPSGRKITHCFVNMKQVNQPIDWAMLASKGILCFLPQYLSEYLTAETPINPRDCVLPEFKKYLTLLPK